ncbi:MAG TPA: DNA internalization-related competence protein ComEC/Rec2 [Bacillota bacterium]|nr:DNA internalization-related competence protein ComEC/Rec2 [Bacillota bacterium]
MKGIREIWVRRPILWILFAYSMGLVLSIYLRIDLLFIYLGMVAIIALALAWRRAIFYCLLCLILLFGVFRGGLFHENESELDQFLDKDLTVTGTVAGLAQSKSDVIHYILNAEQISQGDKIYEVTGRVRVSVYYNGPIVDEAYKSGTLLELKGTLKAPKEARNPGAFDYRAYLARRGIHQTMAISPDSMTQLREGSPFMPQNILATLGNMGASGLDAAVGDEEGDLLKAMLLGQRWLIEPDTSDSFSRTGLAHVLAISGLHVGYIVLLINQLAAVLRLKRKGLFAFRTLVLVFYCLLTGAAASVVRASIMAIIVFGGQAFRRKPDTLNSAGTAALLILLFQPMAIIETGFQLSFIAVCSIALFYRTIQAKLQFLPAKLASLFAVTLAAQVGIIPIIAYYFNIVSLAAILTNPLLIPLFGLLVMAGFILMPIGLIFPGLAFYLGVPAKVVSRLLLDINNAVGQLPFSFIRVVSPSIIGIIVFYAILWIVSRERPSFIKRPIALATAVLVLFLAGNAGYKAIQPKDLTIVFLDVGQGDCTYIRTPDGINILLDGGGREGSDIGKDIVMPFLLKNGVGSLDLVIMSHNHHDHIGGLLTITKELRVKEFLEYPPGETNETYDQLKSILQEKGIKTHTASRGQAFKVGDEISLEVLYPADEVVRGIGGGNENNYSLVILVSHQDTSIMFTGDIEEPVEYYLLSQGMAGAEILKVAHHGSKSSSTKDFLEVVSPQVGVIQVGGNSFGHPNPEVLGRMEEGGIDIYRNDLHGAVICKYSRGEWNINTMVTDN